MSLLNQVLRDLDKRQLAGAPAAVKSSPRGAAPSARQRAGRWALGVAATFAAVVAGGFAQGSLSWPARAATVAEQAAPAAAAVAPVSPTISTLAPAPVAVAAPVVAAAAAPVATPDTVAPTVSAATPPMPAPRAESPRPAPLLTAWAAPVARSGTVAEPKPRTAKPAAEAAPARADVQIDKRAPTRTPRERAEAQYQRGVTAHQAGQIDDSATAFLASLREDPAFHPARLAQAGLLVGQSRGDEALTLLQEGLAASPQQPALSLMLARLQADRQQLDAALSTLQAASTQAAQNPEYLGVHAAVLQRAGRHAEAAEKYGQALRLAPAQGVWWMGLGMSLAATGQGDSAREAFLRARASGSLPPEAGLYVEARLKQLL